MEEDTPDEKSEQSEQEPEAEEYAVERVRRGPYQTTKIW